MTIEPIKKKVTPAELDKVLVGIPRGKPFVDGRVPQGVILHNTWLPNLAMVEDYIAGKNTHGKNPKLSKISEGQLIDNWWVSYKRMHWYSGPHLFIFPTGIFIATPLHIRGTHSPSFNSSHYGVEMVGEYDKEQLPYTIKKLTIDALTCLFRHLGVQATEETLKFHGEDPRTSHKGCPGKNARNKLMWITEINKELNKSNG
jgi:hypothetical protein